MAPNYTILMAVRHWPDIAERAIYSVRQFSDAPILVVDDASPDPRSKAGYEQLARDFNIALCRNEEHLQHGLSLDRLLHLTDTPWVITCDHDVIIEDRRAFDLLLDNAAPDVGAVGRFHHNGVTKHFGFYIHPHWALWNADTIRKYHMSFAGLQIGRQETETVLDFATAQFLCYRLEGLGRGSGEKGAGFLPLRLVGLNLDAYISHSQVRLERGEPWAKKVKLAEEV